MKVEKNFNVDDVVLLYDEHIPCSRWKMGRIVEVYLDSCNRVRQVLVKTSAGSLRRPVRKRWRVIFKGQCMYASKSYFVLMMSVCFVCEMCLYTNPKTNA